MGKGCGIALAIGGAILGGFVVMVVLFVFAIGMAVDAGVKKADQAVHTAIDNTPPQPELLATTGCSGVAGTAGSVQCQVTITLKSGKRTIGADLIVTAEAGIGFGPPASAAGSTQYALDGTRRRATVAKIAMPPYEERKYQFRYQVENQSALPGAYVIAASFKDKDRPLDATTLAYVGLTDGGTPQLVASEGDLTAQLLAGAEKVGNTPLTYALVLAPGQQPTSGKLIVKAPAGATAMSPIVAARVAGGVRFGTTTGGTPGIGTLEVKSVPGQMLRPGYRIVTFPFQVDSLGTDGVYGITIDYTQEQTTSTILGVKLEVRSSSIGPGAKWLAAKKE